MSYDLYKTFSDLIVTKEDYVEAELFTERYLSSQYPTLDLREGSPLRDIVIRPCASLIALVNKGIVKHFNDNTISGATDETPTEAVDAMLSNFFLTRNVGRPAQVLAQVRFSLSIPSTSVTIPVSATFSVDNQNKFSPLEAVTLSLLDGSLQLYTDLTGDQYYYGYITLEAQQSGTSSNVTAGQEFLFFTVFDSYFLGASVRSVSESGVDAETNLEFIARAPNAISTRNLINDPSITHQILSNFPRVNQLLVSGYGDYEQFRDYRLLSLSTSPEPVPVHLGGYVDIYCRTSIFSKVIRVTTDSFGEHLLSFNQPIISVSLPAPDEKAMQNDDGSLVSQADADIIVGDINDLSIEDLQYTEASLVPWENETGFSVKQRILVKSAGTPFLPNQTFDIKILYWDSLDSVQNYLEADNNRVVCGSYLARGFNVVELLPTIRIIDGPPTDPEELESLIDRIVVVISEYVEGLAPAQEFVFTDALAELTTKIQDYQFNNNIDVRAVVYPSQVGNAGYVISPTTGVIDSEYIITNSSSHDENGTTKIARSFVFYIRNSGVTLL